jgi:hypothetical protein
MMSKSIHILSEIAVTKSESDTVAIRIRIRRYRSVYTPSGYCNLLKPGFASVCM